MMNMKSWPVRAAFFFAAIISAFQSAHAAETVKVGLLRSPTVAGLLAIGVDKGFFAAENLTVVPVYFETAQPIALGVASGSIDVGITGLTAAFYSLAGQGQLHIVGGYLREQPTFHATAFVASNTAYAGSLRAYKDFSGHSVALPVLGSPPHYALALLADKYGFDLKSMRLLQLQTNANQVSAVTGGQADIGLIAPNAALGPIQRGDLKLLGWSGDETPWQLGAVFVNAATADSRGDLLRRYLRAYGNAIGDYRAAFAGSDDRRKDNATAPETLAVISKFLGLPVDQVALGIGYTDQRVDTSDILRQIAWYKSQGLVKPEVDGSKIIDTRYVIPLPDK